MHESRPDLISSRAHLVHGQQYSYSYSARPTSFNTSEAVRLVLFSWCAYMDETGWGEVDPGDAPPQFVEGARASLEDGFGGIIEPQSLVRFVDDRATDTQAYLCESKLSTSPVKPKPDPAAAASAPPPAQRATKAAVADAPQRKRVAWADQCQWDQAAESGGRRRSSVASAQQRSVTIACRGSTSIRDWITNLQPVKTRFEPERDLASGGPGYCCDWFAGVLAGGGKPHVHLGFYKCFLRVAFLVRDVLMPKVRNREIGEVSFVGHSLGGALAALLFAYFVQLADVDALVASDVRVNMFSIGQPRVGDAAFCRLVDRLCQPLRKAKLLKVRAPPRPTSAAPMLTGWWWDCSRAAAPRSVSPRRPFA